MKRIKLITKCLSAIGICTTLLSSLPAFAAYPDRPITMIVPWGAGGAGDSVGRIIGALLEKQLGQPVNVINRTGGNGVVGFQAMASAEPDGYTIGLGTGELGQLHWTGLTKLTYEDYTPIAVVSYDAVALTVKADSPYKNVKELVDYIKANPGALKASGTGFGGMWHLGLVGMLKDAGLPTDAVVWVPSVSGAAGLQELAADGVDVIACTLAETRAMADAGKVRSLVLMGNEKNPVFSSVPLLKDELGLSWTNGAWRGVVAPKNIPPEVEKTLADAMKSVAESEEFKSFMAQRGFGTIYAQQGDFLEIMKQTDKDLGAIMKSVGLAQ